MHDARLTAVRRCRQGKKMLTTTWKRRCGLTGSIAAVLLSATGVSFAAASIPSSYFTFSTRSSGSADSPTFGPLNPMRLCSDVQNSTSSTLLYSRLMRNLQFSPDPVQRDYWPTYSAAYGCNPNTFNGSSGEGYYTSASWASESTGHPGFVQITK